MNKRFVLQWHITNNCNNRCTHCYHDSYSGNDPDLETLKSVTQKFISFLKIWNSENNKFFLPGHLNITGGEPFIYKNFIDFLEYLHNNKNYISFAVLTNGSFVTNEIAKKLKYLDTKFVQLSIDGKKETHDKIRGTGDFLKTCNAIKILRAEKIPTYISFTANKQNYKEFSDVEKIASRLGVTKLWSDRMVPFGESNQIKDLMMNTEQMFDYFDIMHKASKRFRLFGKTEIKMERALQFFKDKSLPYKCSAGITLLNLMPDGTVYPCRRLPISVGNIYNSTFDEIYYRNEILKQLRSNQSIPENCSHCSFKKMCGGGAKCLSYAIEKDIFKADPLCPNRKIKNN